MKKILGLDLGTASIGWAMVKERDYGKSEIIKIGSRVIPFTTKESSNFEKGKSSSINADRTSKRGMRRNQDRYKLRRKDLLKILKENKIISDKTSLAEKDTHKLWELRSKAASEKIELEEFARVLLAINKKRGYKSNRKVKNQDEDEGNFIDDMEVAEKLNHENLTPGSYGYQLLKDKKKLPNFYLSDLQHEINRIWDFQKEYYPSLLTEELKEKLKNKNKGQTFKICEEAFSLEDVKASSKLKKIETYKMRCEGLTEKLDLESLASVIQDINVQIKGSSKLLSEISDRSKELHINGETIGQYLYNQIKNDKHRRLKKQVFYRQDYLDEFNRIWDIQAKFYPQLISPLKKTIGNIIIFYQRGLKSQKGLISICELEREEKEIMKDGKPKKKMVGPRVIPKSSPLFQEFKIWQTLNNLVFKTIKTREKTSIQDLDKDLKIRNNIFKELNTKSKLSENQILKLVFGNSKEQELNIKDIQGNRTNEVLYKGYYQILENSGHNKVLEVEDMAEIFDVLGIKKDILYFDAKLEGKDFENQPSYLLWHLLYSYEGDNSRTGNDRLFRLLKEKFGFEKETAQSLVNISFEDSYGSLSAKAIKKILPYLKKGYDYAEACEKSGYNHSHFITKEENKERPLKEALELLPKNSLRNPIVEKILNQMVNVVNAIIKEYGKPDEIRIELARELKKSAKERKQMTEFIDSNTKKNKDLKEELRGVYPFKTGVRITNKDIIKYKLYQELELNAHKTLYTDTYIPKEKLFTKDFEVEHIIPKASLFDDSFSNKTISTRFFNAKKGNQTAVDAVADILGEAALERYKSRVEKLFNNKEGKSKYNKLIMTKSEIPDGFIERDLRATQYISKKAFQMLSEIVRHVTPVTGKITSRLRDQWQLVDVMRELNLEKYKKLGLVEYEENKDGKKIPVIKNWSKRNDHRHHAMDALTIAFTKKSHVQYFNYLNARENKTHKKHTIISEIEENEIKDKLNRLLKSPIPIDEFRSVAKEHLENVLISFKAKNKVATKNKNKIKTKNGEKVQETMTPRGNLHKETIYGTSKYYETKKNKVGTTFDEAKIALVVRKNHREALVKRLRTFDNNPKKAFGGKNALSKTPIYLDKHQLVKLPEEIELRYEKQRFTIRKEVTPDNFKTEKIIDKVVDEGVKKILKQRFQDDKKKNIKPFSDLEKNPIWLNKEKGIKIKSTVITGIGEGEPIHYKKDHNGKAILDDNNKAIPTDYVSTGNNHHIPIYQDKDGNLHEGDCVSFYETVIRKTEGLPIIFKKHPKHPDWEFLFTLKQNEMFVFPNQETGFNPSEIDLLDESNYHLISQNLFRVRKISSGDIHFLHHLETMVTRPVEEDNKNVDIERVKALKESCWKRVISTKNLKGVIKVRINHLGKILSVGE